MPVSLPSDAIYLMDGSAYVYRGFYANKGLQRSDGFPTGSLVVVARTLLRILRRERPRWFCFVHDGRGKNFRHEIYPAYKATREAMPEELVQQIDPIRRMVQALGVRLEISDGCEADDCIASLAARFSAQHPVVIVTGDKDLKQCLGPNVYMWDCGAKDEKIVTAESVLAETGVDVRIWADMQALIGDKVDNIPGVPSIGPKSAAQILALCPGLEEIRDHFALLPPKFQKKLTGHLEEMFLWRRLTTLSRTQCQNLSLEDLAVGPVRVNEAADIVKEFELAGVGREISSLVSFQSKEAPALRRVEAGSPEIPWADTPAPSVNGTVSANPAQPAAVAAPKPSPAKAPAGAGSVTAVKGGSLFDFMTAAPAPEMKEISSPDALPVCAGARVALIAAPASEDKADGYACAVARPGMCSGMSGKGAEEFHWSGTEDDLARWVSQAEVIVVPDVKAVLETKPAFRELFVQRALSAGIFDLGLASYLFDSEENDYGWPRLESRARRQDPAGASLGAGGLALGLEAAFRATLSEEGLEKLYFSLELPLVPVLADMEARGIAIDRTAFAALSSEVSGELKSVGQDVFREAGETFNLRSSRQLGEVLFTKLGLPQTRKTKGGVASTSQEVLEGLAGKHPIVDAILRYRRLDKLQTTYLDPLPALADEAGRLHTTFNQQATATGRLSSSNPNLQNIPVRGDLGRRIRSCFVAEKGKKLISCDYSQVELRVLAHMSRDPELIGAFTRGEDIHTRTAALIYDCSPEEVTSDQRRGAKTINFGLIYGMGAQKLGRELGITTPKAKAFIERYFERLTGLKGFYDSVEENAKRDGYVVTLGSRRRKVLAGLSEGKGQYYALARRQAINTVIQGSAADIIKLAMLAVWDDEELRQMGARMVLQIHDELILEVPEAAAMQAGERVAALMSAVRPGGVEFLVPLAVDWGCGDSWGEAH